MAIQMKGWSGDEMDLYSSTLERCDQVDDCIRNIFANFLHAEKVAAKLPKNISHYYTLKVEKPSQLQWIADQILPGLKEEIDLLLVQRIRRAVKSCFEQTLIDRVCDFPIMADLLQQLPRYLQKNHEKCLQTPFYEGLFGEKSRSRGSAEKTLNAFLKGIQVQYQKIEKLYLDRFLVDLLDFKPYLSTLDCAVLASACPIISGIENVSPPVSLEEIVHSAIQFKEQFSEAKGEDEKFAVALKIINRVEGEFWPTSTPLKLRTLFYLSNHCLETPSFFKHQFFSACTGLKNG